MGRVRGEGGRSPRAPQPSPTVPVASWPWPVNQRLDNGSAIGSDVTVTKEYRPWTPQQAFLLPPSPMDWLPEGHLAYFVLELVGDLDLSAIEDAIQSKDARGVRPYSPRMMTALLLYAYCTGVFSSRRIERATYQDVAFRVLAGGEHPHFTTVNSFRLEHRNALSALFVQVLRLCTRAGLKTVGHVSLDGTKVQANASKHKAMSYGRMKDEEKRLAAEIEALLFRAEQTDQREDEQYGQDKRAEDLPDEFQRRDARLRRIREAKAALEKEAAETRATEMRELAAGQRHKADLAIDATERKRAATRASVSEKRADELSPRNDDDDDASGGNATLALPEHRVPATPQGEPTDKAQRNFTDPDSRIMVRNGEFLQGYNAQAAVSESQVIVAHALTNQPPDQEHLVPMLERVREHCGQLPAVLTADAGLPLRGQRRVLREPRGGCLHCRASKRRRRCAARTAAHDPGARGPLAHAPEGDVGSRQGDLPAAQADR